MSIGIRTAEQRERDALGALLRRSALAWEDDRAELGAHPEALAVESAAIAEGRVRVAAGDDGRPLGFSVVTYVGETGCELDDLFVEPELMRRGIGRALVEDAAARAKGAGRGQMSVVAHPRSVPFYERVGFIVVEPTETRFGPAVRMRLRFAAS